MAKYAPATRLELIDLVKKVEHLGDIDTSAIDDMRFVFFRSDRKNFNGIETWDTSRVKYMSFMFSEAEYFNHNISAWDVSNVESMMAMFERAKRFNQPLGAWNVSNVRNADFMFEHAERFNQPLDNWDLSSVKSIVFMFLEAKRFNQNLDNWRMHKAVDCRLAFAGSKTSPKWYN